MNHSVNLKTAAVSVLLLSAILTACGGETAQNPVTTNAPGGTAAAPAVTEAVTEENRLYPAYELDLGGSDFHMFYFDEVGMCGWSSEIPNDLYAAEETGDILADAVYRRNLSVEEKYNVKLTAEACPDWDITARVSKSVLSGAGSYDAVFPHWQIMQPLITGNYLTQLDSYLDVSMPWWDARSKEGFSVGGKTFALSGDLTFMDKLTDIVLFFNKKMAADYDLGDIYQMVVDHKWTFDKMLEICSNLSADLDNNGKYDKNDRFGFAGQNDASYELFNSSGEKFCSIGSDGVPYLSNDSERAIGVMMRVYEFMNDSRSFFNRQAANLSVADAINMFKSDNVFILMRPLQTVMELRSMNADFGIIPTPLMDDAQTDYYTSIGYTVAIATCIPSDAKDVTVSAAILDTMAAESYYSMNEVFYDMVLGSKVIRDDISRQNLDIIFENHLYDPGCIFGFGGMASEFLNNYKNRTDKVASTIEKFKPKVEKDIEKFMDTLANLE
ncbi:MAG: extracellular solute-binding protein [Clostridia bacterium]|nr:extracellular solute-binding protein [Clostridia bacterium]